MDQPQKILKVLKQAKRIIIPLHINIDGDTVGSALALYNLLGYWGKHADVTTADPLSKSFLFLPEAKAIKEVDPATIDLSQYDLLAALDNGSLSRFSRVENFRIPPHLNIINIDHHKTNGKFGKLNYVIPQVSSTAEILYDLIRKWKVKIDKKIAICLLTGIYTDTGSFQYESTTAQSLEKAAQLIHLGADQHEVVNHIFRDWSTAAISLWVKILANLKTKNRIVYSTLTLKEIKETGIEPQESSMARSFALSYLLRTLSNTTVAILFYEEKKGWVRCSLRSHLKVDVSKIAEKMGGGGHIHAAAFSIKGRMEDAIIKTISLFEEILK